MNLNEFEKGIIVKDYFGNWYKVSSVSSVSSKEDDYQPVRLLCIMNFDGKKYITHPNNTYYEFNAGNEWWITKDELKDFSIVTSTVI